MVIISKNIMQKKGKDQAGNVLMSLDCASGRAGYALAFSCIVIVLSMMAGCLANSGSTPAVSSSPGNKAAAIAWDKEGETLRFSGNLSGATEAYDRAIAIDPDNDDFYLHKGFLERDRERYNESIAAFNKAVQLNPAKNRWLLFDIGVNYNTIGQYADALPIWDQIIGLPYMEQVNIRLSETWNQKGRSLYGLGRYEEAVDAFDRALALDPEHYFAWDSRGEALEKLGRNDEAAMSYRQALKIRPAFEKAKMNLEHLMASSS